MHCGRVERSNAHFIEVGVNRAIGRSENPEGAGGKYHICVPLIEIRFNSVLDQRPKFYSRSRRFRTYGYDSQSLRLFLLSKVFIGSFPRFFQNRG